MNGRKENEEKVNSKIIEMLKESPWYMKVYCRSFTKKSYTTKKQYISHVLKFLYFLKNEFNFNIEDIESFKSVKPSTIESYIASLYDMSEGAKAATMYAVKDFFKFLVKDEYVSSNPCDVVDMPKDNREHKITFLTESEIETVKNNIYNGVGSDFAKARQRQWRSRDYAIVMTALSLGLRVTSLTEIDVDDVSLVDKTIKIVEKGNRIRTIYFSDKLLEVLMEWLKDRDELVVFSDTKALFVSRERQRISPRTIADLIKKYTYNIDKKITPHKLRSTCATNVYNKTGDIYLTADVLGHRNIANTRRYAAVSDERKKRAAAAMDDILF